MFAFPSSCNLLACPSCLLPSCFLPALPVLFASFCDLLSFPYSCNWLAFSCSLLFSLCSSFFAFPYFLLSACLCLLRLAIFPFSCCFRFATAASVLHATLSLVSLTLETCSFPFAPLFSDALPLLAAGVGGFTAPNTTFSIFAPIAVITLTQQAEIHIMDARSSMLQSQCVLIVSGLWCQICHENIMKTVGSSCARLPLVCSQV